MYVIVSPTTGSVDEVDSETYILDTGLDRPFITSANDAAEYINDHHASVIPLKEHIEWREETDLPNADDLYVAGMDTRDDGPVEWKDIAVKLMRERDTLLRGARIDSAKVDELRRKHAEECERIYDARTAGDYTWDGVLYYFLVDLRAAGVNI